jgi:hypothetical protein
MQYSRDCATILRNIVFQKCAPNVLIDIALHHHEREAKISPDLSSHHPELRCVFALIRHGSLVIQS